MPTWPLRIAQISDLHLSPDDDPGDPHWVALAARLAEERPSALVASGDLVDGSLRDVVRARKAFQRADVLLRSLCSAAGCGAENLVVVAGNHDVRWSGISPGIPFMRSAFAAVFGPHRRILRLRTHDLLFATFDSNARQGPLSLAQGVVDRAQLADLQLALDAADPRRTCLRIAVLHHHPLPLVDRTRPLTNRDEFLLLKNAGVFLSELLRSDVDVALHGHKHRFHVSRIAHPAAAPDRVLAVVGAGSVRRSNPPEFHILSLEPSGAISVQRFLMEGASFADQPPLPVVPYAAVRERYRTRLLRNAGPLRIERYRRKTVVAPLLGDAEVSEQFLNARARGAEPVAELSTTVRSEKGYFQARRYAAPEGRLIDWRWNGPPKDGARSASVVYTPPIDERPVSYSGTYTMPNAFALEAADPEGGPDERVEHTSCRIRQEVDSMEHTVILPPDYPLAGYSAEVRDAAGHVDHHETSWLLNHCYRVPEAGVVGFAIGRPLPGHAYRLSWSLPPAEPVAGEAERSFPDDLRQRLRERKGLESLARDLEVRLREFAKIDDVALYVPGLDGRTLVPVWSRGTGETPFPEIDAGRTIVGRGHREGRRRTARGTVDVLEDPDADPRGIQAGFRAAIPIGLDDEDAVLVAFFADRAIPSPLSPDCVAALEALCRRWFFASVLGTFVPDRLSEFALATATRRVAAEDEAHLTENVFPRLKQTLEGRAPRASRFELHAHVTDLAGAVRFRFSLEGLEVPAGMTLYDWPLFRFAGLPGSSFGNPSLTRSPRGLELATEVDARGAIWLRLRSPAGFSGRDLHGGLEATLDARGVFLMWREDVISRYRHDDIQHETLSGESPAAVDEIRLSIRFPEDYHAAFFPLALLSGTESVLPEQSRRFGAGFQRAPNRADLLVPQPVAGVDYAIGWISPLRPASVEPPGSV